MDNAHLVVVASCSTSLHVGTKIRFLNRGQLVDGRIQHAQYSVDQPAMHALYCNSFHAVDVMNRLLQGPGCLSNAWQTYDVRQRLFAASLSACATNAYQGWIQEQNLTSSEYSQCNLQLDLALQLAQVIVG
jgi:hypothetical protein